MKTRITLKTLLVITLVVAAYFAGRNAGWSARIDEYEKEVHGLQKKLESPPPEILPKNRSRGISEEQLDELTRLLGLQKRQ